MIAVIFEVEPAEGRRDEYLDIAARMRPMLDQIEGFISVERFQSLTNPGKLLSLSFFEDEDAILRWRTLSAHRGAQQEGRGGVFDDYRLRIAGVIRDYGMFDRAEAPSDSRQAHPPCDARAGGHHGAGGEPDRARRPTPCAAPLPHRAPVDPSARAP